MDKAARCACAAVWTLLQMLQRYSSQTNPAVALPTPYLLCFAVLSAAALLLLSCALCCRARCWCSLLLPPLLLLLFLAGAVPQLLLHDLFDKQHGASTGAPAGTKQHSCVSTSIRSQMRLSKTQPPKLSVKSCQHLCQLDLQQQTTLAKRRRISFTHTVEMHQHLLASMVYVTCCCAVNTAQAATLAHSCCQPHLSEVLSHPVCLLEQEVPVRHGPGRVLILRTIC